MKNNTVIKNIEQYLYKNKSVDIKWYLNDKVNGLGIEKNAREIDIIVQEVLSKPWFTQYSGHNTSDISIKYNFLSRLSFYIGLIGGIVGFIGGLLGIISFFINL
jgi:hypothetical protein